ncbi:syntaxin-17 [Bacillus rossius redtenbacheri]|uniref:syntaxin-17 n=1 Tax=Bacillus rossius redtenbacheri TaxID=93214 RepID=UPI002FDE39B3
MQKLRDFNSVPKQPLKRVEIALHKFNDVAVPHHVDLLQRHKNNIEKFQLSGSWEHVHREQINATRLIKQLKALLLELELLRSQVQDSDLEKFDKLTAAAKTSASGAIDEYLAVNPQRLSPVWLPAKHDAAAAAGAEGEGGGEQLQLTQSASQEDLEKLEACARSWTELQEHAQDVHELFQEFARVVKEQKNTVDDIEANVEESAENVSAGVTSIYKAARYKSAMYPVAGALLGGCLGGPVGLLAGLKLGGLAAVGCGLLGFTGGHILKKRQHEDNDNSVEMVNCQHTRNMKGSVSLPHIVGAHTSSGSPKKEL